MILRGHWFSKTLEMETGITVVGPNETPREGSYKAVYLLHGLCGRSGDWADYTVLPVYANEGPFVFIMPEVSRSFYTDMEYGLKYFSYVTEELPALCKSLFNISAKREDTAVIGASMGGYGALKCALRKPEKYGYCAAFSSACLYLQEGLAAQRQNPEAAEKMYGGQLVKDFYAAFGPDLRWDKKNEILELAKSARREANKPVVYLACGAEDYFHDFHLRFKADLEKLAFDFTYEEWPGHHDWAFFNEALKKALRHFSKRL